MGMRNNKEKTSKTNNNLSENKWEEEQSELDLMLDDAFSFMKEREQRESEIDSAVFEQEGYEKTADEQPPVAGKVKDESSEEMKKEKKKKTLYSVLIAVLSVLIVVAILGIVFSGPLGEFIKKLNGTYDEGDHINNSGEMLEDEEDFETMFSVNDAASMNDFLKKWANNGGEIMDSKNVINILLIGQDGDGSDTRNGRADSIIIASVNKTNKTITLASVMRDSYTYMNIGGRDRYDKINSSCYYGGPKAVIDTIEANYKIDIDYYASVHFESFKSVIDALGGVEVPIEPGLAAYINRTTRQHVTSGDAVLLNGEEALVYARIRYFYSDSDVSRTANQRRVINGIMKKAKGASVGQLIKVIDAVLPYMKTNMPKTTIISYGTQALTEGWINYQMNQETFPVLEARATATINGASCWAVDYPLAAQQLQKLLYGKTNISLDPNRVNILKNYLVYKPSYNPNTETGTGATEYISGVTELYTGESTTFDPNAPTEESTTRNPWLPGWWPGEDETTAPPVTENPTQTPTSPPAPTQPPATTPPTQALPTNPIS